MSRKLSIPVVACVLLLAGSQLMAGGPPRLCLPMNGVTPDNAEACASRLAGALGGKVMRVEVLQNEEQWYALLTLGEDVKLSAVEAALKGSPFSVPRDRLRLFGHVILEVELRTATSDELISDLAALKYVWVGESSREKGVLLVTLEMPYPEDAGRQTTDFGRIPFGKEIFRRTDLSSNVSTKSERPASARTLPSYVAVRDVLAKHKVSLKDIRWSTSYACRMLGCVTVPDADADPAAGG